MEAPGQGLLVKPTFPVPLLTVSSCLSRVRMGGYVLSCEMQILRLFPCFFNTIIFALHFVKIPEFGFVGKQWMLSRSPLEEIARKIRKKIHGQSNHFFPSATSQLEIRVSATVWLLLYSFQVFLLSLPCQIWKLNLVNSQFYWWLILTGAISNILRSIIYIVRYLVVMCCLATEQ